MKLWFASLTRAWPEVYIMYLGIILILFTRPILFHPILDCSYKSRSKTVAGEYLCMINLNIPQYLPLFTYRYPLYFFAIFSNWKHTIIHEKKNVAERKKHIGHLIGKVSCVFVQNCMKLILIAYFLARAELMLLAPIQNVM